jgi:methionyl-tRNA synthetase
MNNLVTTAISYTNGSPHIGHLYESVLSDFMKHLLIISGKNTKLLTGTDEHGKKIEETAIKNNIKPIDLCNKYSEEFKKLNNNIKTKYDNFIRTTDEDHILLVQEALKKVLDDGNIYLGTYKGWYNTREETFMSELDCKLNNYIDPVSGKPYELIEEETYYFKLSKFKNELIDYVKTLNVNEYVKNELDMKLKEIDLGNDKPYNRFNIYPLVIIMTITWILIIIFILKYISFYYSSYYIYIIILITIILLLISSIWFLYVNNDLIM